MSDEAPTPEQIETEARSIGWVPKEDFHGNPESWVDAKTFVEKGKTFIPYLQADRRKLQGQVTQLNTELSGLKDTLKEANESISALREYNSKEQVQELEAEIKSLRTQLAAARKEGDTDTEVDLEAQLDDTRDKLREAKANGKAGPARAQESPPAIDYTKAPEFQQFLQDNPWWQTDAVMRAASLAIGNELAAQGSLEGLAPAQRFAKIAEATKKRFGLTDQPRHSRVEGGGRGSGGSGTGSRENGKSYSDLPPDAQTACDRLYNRLKAAYPKKEDWQKKYAQDYFNS